MSCFIEEKEDLNAEAQRCRGAEKKRDSFRILFSSNNKELKPQKYFFPSLLLRLSAFAFKRPFLALKSCFLAPIFQSKEGLSA